MGAGGRRDAPGVSAAKLPFPFSLPLSHFLPPAASDPCLPSPTQGWAVLSSMMGLGCRLSWPLGLTPCHPMAGTDDLWDRSHGFRGKLPGPALAHLQPLMNKNSIRTLVLERQLFQDSLLERQGISFSKIKLCTCQYSTSIDRFLLGVSRLNYSPSESFSFWSRLAVGSHASGLPRDASDSLLNFPSGLLFGAARLPLTVERTAFESLRAFCHKDPSPFTSPFSSPVLWMWHSVPRPDFRDVKNTLNMGCHSNCH